MSTLTECNLEGQNLTNANISGVLSDVSFCDSNLTGAILSNSEIESADFTNAIIKNVTLGSAIKNGFTKEMLYSTASYKNKDLGSISFYGGDNILGWNLSGQNLQNANFNSVDLENVDLAGADLRGAEMSSVKGDFILKNTIMSDGYISNFSMTSSEDNLFIRKYTPIASASSSNIETIFDKSVSISGGASVVICQGASVEIEEDVYITVENGGNLKIQTDVDSSTLVSFAEFSGLVFNDGSSLTVEVTGDIDKGANIDIMTLNEDVSIVLSGLVKNENFKLILNDNEFFGDWEYFIADNKLSVSIQIPEPSIFAAIFGALVLGFALRYKIKRI